MTKHKKWKQASSYEGITKGVDNEKEIVLVKKKGGQ